MKTNPTGKTVEFYLSDKLIRKFVSVDKLQHGLEFPHKRHEK